MVWLFLMALIVLALAGISQSVSAAPGTYEQVFVTLSYDVKVVDDEGKPLTGIEQNLNPVPAGNRVQMTFKISTRDTDTDIDTINITFSEGVTIDDASGLSQNESGSDGDWMVDDHDRYIVYFAVTDNGGAEDDALDRNEKLTLVVIANMTEETGLLSASIRVWDHQGPSDGDKTNALKEFDWVFIKVSDGDRFLLSSLSYPSPAQRCNLLITHGSSMYGTDPDGTEHINFPDATGTMSYATTFYIFLIDDPTIAQELTYLVSNPTGNTPIPYTLQVTIYSVMKVTGEPQQSINLSRQGVTGLSRVMNIEPNEKHEYLYAPHILGDAGGSYFLDDADDDDDNFTDEEEIAYGSDYRDPRDHPPIIEPGTDRVGGGTQIPLMIAMIASLAVVVVVTILLLLKLGLIGGMQPKKPKMKRKPRRKEKHEAEIEWEKPKRSRIRAKGREKKAAPPVEEEEEKLEEEIEAEKEEAPPVEEEAAEVEEIEEEDLFDELDEDLDFEELEAELAELEEDLDEEDLFEDEELDEELEEDLDEEDLFEDEELDEELDEDLDFEELEAEFEHP